jgi:hypothetical protein
MNWKYNIGDEIILPKINGYIIKIVEDYSDGNERFVNNKMYKLKSEGGVYWRDKNYIERFSKLKESIIDKKLKRICK